MKKHPKLIAQFALLAAAPLVAHLAVPSASAQDDSSPGGTYVGVDVTAPSASGDANFQSFYDNLDNQGTWIQTEDYGYVWQPNISDENWRPYTLGHWVYTDAGWAWASDEPFGWATYHYGRWANINGVGWVWIPGYTWAPAWVSWRHGGGYYGWAPLPPESFENIDYVSRHRGEGGISLGFHIGADVDISFNIGAGCYNFCPEGRMGDPDVHRYMEPPQRNFIVINQTTNITNVNYHPGAPMFFSRVNIGGPSFTEVNRVAFVPVSRVNLSASASISGLRLSGTNFVVYAPRLSAAPVSGGAVYRPARVGMTISTLHVNRGQNIAQPMRPTRLVVHMATPTDAEIAQAHQAARNAPSNARVAVEPGPSKPVFHVSEVAPAAYHPAPVQSTPPQQGFHVNPNGQTEHSPTATRLPQQQAQNQYPASQPQSQPQIHPALQSVQPIPSHPPVQGQTAPSNGQQNAYKPEIDQRAQQDAQRRAQAEAQQQDAQRRAQAEAQQQDAQRRAQAEAQQQDAQRRAQAEALQQDAQRRAAQAQQQAQSQHSQAQSQPQSHPAPPPAPQPHNQPAPSGNGSGQHQPKPTP